MTPNPSLIGSPVETMVSAAVGPPLNPHHQLSFVDKLALWVSWAVAAGIFFTLGWMVLAPEDPYGAVSLVQRRGSLGIWLQALGLTLVSSLIGTILVGRSLPFAGPFAAALGLAVVSLRGRTAESLLIAAKSTQLSAGSLALWMGLESLAWLAMILMAFVVGEIVANWCYPGRARGYKVQIPLALQKPHWFALAGIAATLLAFNILGAGMHSREIRHPQVCFVVGASVWLGCWIAFRVAPARGILWYLIPVAVLTLAGYGWAAFQNDPPHLPVSVPPSIFLRVLPIQFVAVGTAAAIAAFWSNSHHFDEYAGEVPERWPEDRS